MNMSHKWVQQLKCCWMIIISVFVEIFKKLLSAFQNIKEVDVKNEIILITGAAQGIGKELAFQYGQLEATVICVDIQDKENEETVQSLKMIGVKAYGFQCDIANHEDVKILREKIEKEIGEITILVANAGVACKSDYIENVADADIQRVININLMSLFWMLKEFLPSMKKNNKGHIVVISSITGLGPLPGVSTYSVSKCAVAYLMRATREEVEQQGLDIKFTTMYPDFTDTLMCEKLRSKMPKMLKASEVAKAAIQAQRQGKSDASIPTHLFKLSKILSAIKTYSGLEIKYYTNLLEGAEIDRRWPFGKK